MRVRVPLNQILFKYTSGNEYIVLSTQKEYQGYYYELNNKFFSGKEFTDKSLEIIKITSSKVNKQQQNPSTEVYSKISGISSTDNEVSSQPVGGNVPEVDFNSINFYCKKVNSNSIKQIDENTYLKLTKDPIYQTSFVGIFNNRSKSLDEANTEIPGLRDWYLSDQLSFLSLSKEELNPAVSSQQLFAVKPLSQPPTPIGNITDTPKPQDVVPVGPIIIINS